MTTQLQLIIIIIIIILILIVVVIKRRVLQLKKNFKMESLTINTYI